MARVVHSVLRPLAAASGPGRRAEPDRGEAAPDDTAELAWDAARFATELRARLAAAAPPAMLEATAALQDLAC